MSKLTNVVSFAEYCEDSVLWGALANVRNGFYVDVGAMDPVKASVTKLFYNRGWSGINIEPCPRWFEAVAEQRPRDINLQMAASDHAGSLTLHEIPDTGLSTSVDRYAKGYDSQGMARRSYSVPCKPLADICAEHVQGDIHFLKIDVEGAEKSVLDGCDFSRFRPWLLAIEATEPCTYTPSHAEWEPLVLDAGYDFALSHEINRYYVARERIELKSRIQPPPST